MRVYFCFGIRRCQLHERMLTVSGQTAAAFGRLDIFLQLTTPAGTSGWLPAGAFHTPGYIGLLNQEAVFDHRSGDTTMSHSLERIVADGRSRLRPEKNHQWNGIHIRRNNGDQVLVALDHRR